MAWVLVKRSAAVRRVGGCGGRGGGRFVLDVLMAAGVGLVALTQYSSSRGWGAAAGAVLVTM
jgi:hypothetical protein